MKEDDQLAIGGTGQDVVAAAATEVHKRSRLEASLLHPFQGAGTGRSLLPSEALLLLVPVLRGTAVPVLDEPRDSHPDKAKEREIDHASAHGLDEDAELGRKGLGPLHSPHYEKN